MGRVVVQVPRLGVTVERVVLLEWLVAVGEPVKSGDALARVETDKVETEVVAPHDGRVVEQCVDVEDEVDVGAPLCVVDTV